MAVKVKRKGTQLRAQGVTRLVAEYVQVRKMKRQWEERENVLKARIESIVNQEGEEDDKGSLWYTLPEEVEGFTKLYKQKRVSQVLDEVVAETELTKLDLWDECARTVTVVDEDALLALAFQDKIPEEIMKLMYDEKVSYALYVK